MKQLADDNLLHAQRQQKLWNDKCSRKRDFFPNNLVLLLLTRSTNKLLAKCQGPCQVL